MADTAARPSTTCPVCSSEQTQVFVTRTGVPVHQHQVFDDPVSAVHLQRGILQLAYCERCGFVFNQAFDLSELSYGPSYDNTQTCSPTFTAHVDALVDDLVTNQGVRNARIIEVGCGHGVFLRKLIEAEGANNQGYGFDPAYIGPERVLNGRLRFEKRFYDATCVDIPADVVLCRHVIEHVPEPIALLTAIRQAVAASPRARVFFETPCVDWILRNGVIWDVFYEHCSLFTAESLTTAFEIAGFKVDRVDHLFGGQYLWLAASVPSEPVAHHTAPGQIPELATFFGKTEQHRRASWQSQLENLKRRGNVAIWGAGAKGVTLANLVDPGRELISAVVDLNPNKQGRYLPGTGHPIIEPAAIEAYTIRSAVVMNPNYVTENERILAEAGIEVKLVEPEMSEGPDAPLAEILTP